MAVSCDVSGLDLQNSVDNYMIRYQETNQAVSRCNFLHACSQPLLEKMPLPVVAIAQAIAQSFARWFRWSSVGIWRQCLFWSWLWCSWEAGDGWNEAQLGMGTLLVCQEVDIIESIHAMQMNSIWSRLCLFALSNCHYIAKPIQETIDLWDF